MTIITTDSAVAGQAEVAALIGMGAFADQIKVRAARKSASTEMTDAMVVTYVAPQNPHKAGTPTWDIWAKFVGTEGMSLKDLRATRGVSLSQLKYRVTMGVVAVAAAH